MRNNVFFVHFFIQFISIQFILLTPISLEITALGFNALLKRISRVLLPAAYI